jgi:tetratricopeptide (TPR) repeat protein
MQRFHFHRLALAVLAAALIVAATVRAEPTDQIPDSARQRYTAGQDLEKQGKLKEAVAAYDEAIRLGMQLFPRVYLKQGGALLELKDYDAAIARYTKIIDGFGLEDSCRY